MHFRVSFRVSFSCDRDWESQRLYDPGESPNSRSFSGGHVTHAREPALLPQPPVPPPHSPLHPGAAAPLPTTRAVLTWGNPTLPSRADRAGAAHCWVSRSATIAGPEGGAG